MPVRNAMSVMLKNIRWDEVEQALCVTDPTGTRTSEGESFVGSRFVDAVSAAGTVDVLVTTAADAVVAAVRGVVQSPSQVLLNLATGVAGKLGVYEGTTTSSSGSVITAYNLNRTSAVTLSATITHTPVITGIGTLLGEFGLGDEKRFVLASSQTYLFRVTNLIGQTGAVGISLVLWKV